MFFCHGTVKTVDKVLYFNVIRIEMDIIMETGEDILHQSFLLNCLKIPELLILQFYDCDIIYLTGTFFLALMIYNFIFMTLLFFFF